MKRQWKAAFLLLTLFFVLRSAKGKLRMVVIDTDGGPDDAWAITLLLGAEKLDPDMRVVAITCVYGNTRLKYVERNILMTLSVLNRTDIPVYSGAESSLIPVPNYIDNQYFGEDGFGDVNLSIPINGRIRRSKHAAIAILDLIHEFNSNLSIVSLGPLTNIATVVALDKNALKNLQNLVIMGGSINAVGNIAPNVEFNFYQDPWANFMVLNSSMSEPVVQLPWETATKMNISIDWRVNKLGKIDNPAVRMLNRAEELSLGKSKTWVPADLLTVAIAIYETLITKFTVTNVTPVFEGMAKGSCLVDYGNLTGKPANALLVQDLDVVTFKRIVMDTLSSTSIN